MRSQILSCLGLALLATTLMAPVGTLARTNSTRGTTPRHGKVIVVSSGASRPMLQLTCGIPNSQDIVGCKLSGRGFRPRELVRITYRLTFTSVPRVHGHLQGKVHTRTAMTDGRGAFDRPPLRFGVIRYHESFRLTAIALGSSGDRATVTTFGIAQ